MSGKSHWYPAYIGLGSNLDGPVGQIQSAFERLDEMAQTRLVQRSFLYRSAPYGGVEQADFVNAVAALLTRLPPEKLLRQLQSIETQRGRVRDVRWGPRVLDLDILVYSDRIVDTDDLKLPHPGIAIRNFVLLQLLDVAPDLWIPGLGLTKTINVNTSEPSISRLPEN